jgi:hypothetical protein
MRWGYRALLEPKNIFLPDRCSQIRKKGAMRTRTFAVLLLSMLLAATLLSAKAEATIIQIGEIDLTGRFTLNPLYNFNQPTAQPFGTFADVMAVQASGIFAPFVISGDALVMSTPNLLSPPLLALSSDKPLAGQMPWSIGGFTIDTTWDHIAGADSGRDVLGLVDLSGNGFNPADYTLGAFVSWDFTAPPYDISNFHQPITGPVNMKIAAAFDDGKPLPEDGSTLVLLALGLMGIGVFRRALAF